MDETKAGQEAKARALKNIRQEQRYAEKRIAQAIRRGEEGEAFFSGYRNGLGYAYRCIIDATSEPARPAPPTPDGSAPMAGKEKLDREDFSAGLRGRGASAAVLGLRARHVRLGDSLGVVKRGALVGGWRRYVAVGGGGLLSVGENMTPAPPTGEREGARGRLREALEGFIAVHVEDGVCGPESSAKAEGGPEWCGWCEDAREALALDATSPAAYCAPCGSALTDEEVMCVDCASDAAPAQPGEGEPSADELANALEAVVNSFTRPEEEAAHAAARALLERRGKGLSGKGDGR